MEMLGEDPNIVQGFEVDLFCYTYIKLCWKKGLRIRTGQSVYDLWDKEEGRFPSPLIFCAGLAW